VPPKPADEAGEYEFQGWDKEVIPCHGDAVYTAVFALKQEETVPETTAPTEPEGTEPTDGTVPTDATDPEETQPTPTDPLPTDPPVTEPQPTDPQPTDPQPTEPQPTEPQPTEPEWPRTGTVVTDDGSRVNVRDLPSTKGEIRYKLYPGDPVTIYETVYDGTTYWWGRLEDGNWICMDYVKLDEETDPPVTEPTDPTEPPTEPTDPPPTEPVEPEYTPGDVNGDDKVDEDDVIYLLRHLFLPDTYPVRIPADYDRSGTVNEDDVIYLLRSLFMPDKYPLSISKI